MFAHQYLQLLVINLLTRWCFGNNISSDNVKYENNVQIDGQSVGILTISQNEEPADAVYTFGLKYGLDVDTRRSILKSVCSNLPCKRTEALLWSKPINDGSVFVGNLEVYENTEPVDAIQTFLTKHKLSVTYRDEILRSVCDVVPCSRFNPVIWKKIVNVDKNRVELMIKEGEEPVDVIYHELKKYQVSLQDRQRVLNEAKRDGIPLTRDYAKVFSKNILIDGESSKNNLVIYENGKEPIDQIYEFTQHSGLSHVFQQISDSILPIVCKDVLCSRTVPVIWSKQILSEEGNAIGLLYVEKDEEPIDAVDRFITNYNLDGALASGLLQKICADMPCKRSLPLIFKKSINDEKGNKIGAVEIFEGEEVIDSVYRFLKNIETDVDQIAIKNYFLENACTLPRVKCTRNVAHVFDRQINLDDGSQLGRLLITEHEEPADKVHKWCEELGVAHAYENLIDSVCLEDSVKCNRKYPIMFSLPLKDHEGNYIGNVEVKVNEEPVDAIYRFFAKYDLFQKKWDFQGVVAQICDLPALTCNRRQAVKYYKPNFQMGNVSVGALVVWENEEVVDKLFEKRITFNLTVHDQVKSFNDICNNEDVYCERYLAAIYRLTDITKKDYERFGNETCSRKYAGWQFLSSVASNRVGSKLSKLIQLEGIGKVISSPIFPFTLLWVLCYLSSRMLNIHFVKQRIHLGHKVATYCCVVLIVCLSQSQFIEPVNEIDKAMHLYEGKLPDLIILEDDEPVDKILKWGKLASKDHHPIVREPIYWKILEKVCEEIKVVECTRRRAWESIDMGSLTVMGQKYNIEFMNPGVVPGTEKITSHNDKNIIRTATNLCQRIHPMPHNCINDIASHIYKQLSDYELNRFESKDTYVKLGLAMDAPDRELYYKLASIVRMKGSNISPFKRVDNGTAVYHEWDMNTREASFAIDTHHKVRNPESREWNDKPCTPYFGGALCAKTDKDGNMIIET